MAYIHRKKLIWGMGIAFLTCIVGIGGLLSLGIFGTAAYPEARTIGKSVQSFQELSGAFEALADMKGAVYAYSVLARAELPPNTDLHLLGHAVGDVLFRQKGLAGIAVCTPDFRNACSHSIVIGALNEFGPVTSTIEKIRNACTRAPGGSGAYTMCFHGLGHGVFAYFGYDIPKTVNFCKRLGTAAYGEEEYMQCVGGMTMELIDGGGHDIEHWVAANTKYLDPQDPLAPCNRTLIPADAKSFCYMYLTPHLFEAAGADLAHPDPATFPWAFKMCDEETDSKLRSTCYGSFGKEFVPLAGARDIRAVDRYSDEAYSMAIKWCGLAAALDGRESCIGEALGSIFWGGENDPRASVRFCSLVSEDTLQASCYRSLAENISRYTPDASDTCALLPSDFRDTCMRDTTSTPTQR